MIETIASILILIGSIFILIAAVGILRMPDLYMRMSATTKASTLGVGIILFGMSILFFEFGIVSRLVAIIIFLLLTAPVAAHIIGRAGYLGGSPLWKNSIRDDLKKKFEKEE